MLDIQSDVYDECARILLPRMLDIVRKNKKNYYNEGSEEMKILSKMEEILRKFNYEIAIESKPALIYNLWYAELVSGLFTTQFKDDFERNSLIRHFYSSHFFGNIITRWAAGNETDESFCENTNNKLKKDKCLFNVVDSLVNTYKNVVESFGKDEVRL